MQVGEESRSQVEGLEHAGTHFPSIGCRGHERVGHRAQILRVLIVEVAVHDDEAQVDFFRIRQGPEGR